MTTDYLRPNSNVTSVFTVFDYTNIDDNVLTGAAGDGLSCTIDRTDDNEQQQWGLTAPVESFTEVTSCTVHLRSYNDDDGDTDVLHARLLLGGVWTGYQDITMGGGSYTWTSCEITGSWSGSDFTSAQIELKTDSIASSDNFQLDVLYVELNGTGSVSYDETGSGGCLLAGSAIVKPDIIAETHSPSDSTNDTSSGSVAWTNVGNIYSADAAVASVGPLSSTSNILKATDFGFTLPDIQYLSGIEINITRYANDDNCGGAGHRVTDTLVSLLVDGTVSGTNNQDNFTPANACTSWDATSITHTYGGPNEMWGLDLDSTDITTANFGCAFQVNGNRADETAFVDHVEMTVYYQNSVPEIFDEIGSGGCVLSGEMVSDLTCNVTGDGGCVLSGGGFATTCPDSIACDNFTGTGINLTAHYLDALNGSNDEQWTIVNGTWTIDANRLKNEDEQSRLIYVDVGQSSYSATMTYDVPTGTANMFQGFITRYSNNTNYIRANYNALLEAFQIWTIQSGSFNLRASTSVSLSGTETLFLDVNGNSITLSDGSTSLTYETSFNNTATGLGITVGVVPASGTYTPTYIDSFNVSSISFNETGSGGIVFSGQSALSAGYVFESDGGIVFGGNAPSFRGFVFIPTGQITFSGETPVEWRVAKTGSGKIQFSGITPVTSSHHEATARGGIEFYDWAGVTIGFSHLPTGQITFSATANHAFQARYTGQDGIRFSGITPVTFTTSQYEYESEGGITFSGEIEIHDWFSYPDGGIIFGGRAEPVSTAYSWFADGQITFSNSADVQSNIEQTATGGITFGGQATANVVYLNYIPTGGITFSDSASVIVSYTTDPVSIFHNGYKFKRLLKYNSASNQTNFPLLFTETLGTGKITSSSACDVIFETYDHTQLNHEIEYFDSSTGQLFAHFKTTLEKGDNYFWMYYGKVKEICDEENVSGTWSQYANVYHLNEDGDGTASEYVDVKGSLNGTARSPIFIPEQITGKIHKGQDFSPISTYIKTADDEIANTNDWSVSSWVKTPSFIAGKQVIWSRNKTDLGNDEGWSIEMGINGSGYPTASVQIDNGDETWSTITATSSSQLTASTWYHLALVWDSGSSIRIYVNGVEKGSTSTVKTNLADGSAGNYIGRRDTGSYFKGIIDELRVSQTAFTASWLLNEYNSGNQSLIVGHESTSLNFHAIVPPYINLFFVGTGGITFSGTGQSFFPYWATGQIDFGGNASNRFSIGNQTGNGGITFSGSADNAMNVPAQIGSGGITFSNSADVTVAREVNTSGGLTFTGSADNAMTVPAQTATGQISFSGTATNSFATSNQNGSGGIAFSGTTDHAYQSNASITGGIILSGDVSVIVSREFLTDGQITFSNSADVRFIKNNNGSGGIEFGGQATNRFSSNHEPDGQITFSNSAGVEVQTTYEPSGVLMFSGNAQLLYHDARGGINFDGISSITVNRSYIPLGGIRFGKAITDVDGEMTGEIIFPPTLSGEIVFPPTLSGEIYLEQIATGEL
ncbi:hypothetical protein Pla110_32890 [Polystyrenella longa]|uniref:LamG-like jellyroll fold domain-containing protein n=1 Tax=Polystyrenella longa TaxID=2528007 RepID=A0A518CQP1_9PLAN|nr:LamG domain-containing protein [Polystyrenella longa]QDU81547.1 hypothetical protein Pla110_32890 [Polystyrenella longa]